MAFVQYRWIIGNFFFFSLIFLCNLCVLWPCLWINPLCLIVPSLSLPLLYSRSCLTTPLCCWHHLPTNHAFVCPEQAPTPELCCVIFLRPQPTQAPISCSILFIAGDLIVPRPSLPLLPPHCLLFGHCTSSMWVSLEWPQPQLLVAWGNIASSVLPRVTSPSAQAPLGRLNRVGSMPATCLAAIQVLGSRTAGEPKSFSHRARLVVEELPTNKSTNKCKQCKFQMVGSTVKYMKVRKVDGPNKYQRGKGCQLHAPNLYLKRTSLLKYNEEAFLYCNS